VAWQLSERNDLELVLNTLKQLEGKPVAKNALIHSEQGFQYTTRTYENKVKELKIQGSHSRKGNDHLHSNGSKCTCVGKNKWETRSKRA
jgi:putative transposase